MDNTNINEIEEVTEESSEVAEASENEATVTAVAEKIVDELNDDPETDEDLNEEKQIDEDTAAEERSSEDISNDATTDETTSRNNSVTWWVKALFVIALTLLVVSASLLSFIMVVSRDMAFELGSKKEFKRIEDSAVISKVCKVVNDNIDTYKLGTYNVNLRFFGFINQKMKVNVVDTKAPEVELYNLRVPMGTRLDAEMFVKKINDLTETEVYFKNKAPKTDKTGNQEIKLCVSDSSGNETLKIAKLAILGDTYSFVLEYGDDEYLNKIRGKYPDVTDNELSPIKIDEVGQYTVEFIRNDTYNVFNVFVNDTVPPEATVKSLVVRTGEVVEAKDLVVSVTDKSEVDISFKDEPDITTPGVYDVLLVFRDEYNNVAEVASKLAVCCIPTELVLEHGFTKYELNSKIFENIGAQTGILSLSTEFESIIVGDNTLTLAGDLGSLDLKLTVTDHKAPELVLKELRSYVGVEVAAKDFVRSCIDASSVEFSFVSIPSVNATGSFPVSIIAKDASGNSTEKQTYLHISKDTLPPVIYGVKNITVRSGGTVSYKNGVYAIDGVWGDVEVNVDSSKVNLNEQGSYAVVYSATDKSGNTATVTAYVTVTGVSYNTVYSMADQVLGSIVNNAMSDRDKAWAIYSWVTANFRYSTRTSYLMGNFVEGAYSGFTIRSGNCYIYYAVTSALLTRAGIENIEIQRNDPSNPHYWNLVKIDGSWYHLDTCPHFAGHKMTAFLLTDAQVKAYSQNEVAGYYSFDESKYPDTP
ncbi:MAG: transglutaminase domain-containing protein [Clostridia bacterium]|nr:transglutaminase domain-containing protein [Clostridia bacterium]